MTVQPSRTPAQQAVDDAIWAWRETSGIPVSQPCSCKMTPYRGSKTAPAGAANTSGSGASPIPTEPEGLTA